MLYQKQTTHRRPLNVILNILFIQWDLQMVNKLHKQVQRDTEVVQEAAKTWL